MKEEGENDMRYVCVTCLCGKGNINLQRRAEFVGCELEVLQMQITD